MKVQISTNINLTFTGDVDIDEEVLKQLRELRDSSGDKTGGLRSRLSKFIAGNVINDWEMMCDHNNFSCNLEDVGYSLSDCILDSVIVIKDYEDEEIL